VNARKFSIVALLALVVTVSLPGRPEGQEKPVQQGSPGGHGEHGTPRGWKFTWPKGNPAKGREVFVKLECYSCHEVKGEKFPAPSDEGQVGPELSAMGPLHEPEYFAEAIIHPNAVIEKGKGYTAADGSSKMPSFNDAVTVQEVVDLVAFLRSLKPPATAPAPARMPKPPDAGHGKGH
jgi:mono/diheme cytochrome c family protein